MDIAKQVAHFTALPYETKRAKVIDMLRQLQRTHETFAMFYKTVSSVKNISESSLAYLYQSILEIAQELESGRKDQAQDKIRKISEVMMAIKKQEEQERNREGDPDETLKNI